MGVVWKVIDMVQGAAPNRDHLASRVGLEHLFTHLRLDFDLLIGCLGLVDQRCLAVRIHKLTEEAFWSLVCHKETASDAEKRLAEVDD